MRTSRKYGPVIRLRNTAAHSGNPPRAAVLAAREEIVGIGHEGLVTRIARVKLRAGQVTPNRAAAEP